MQMDFAKSLTRNFGSQPRRSDCGSIMDPTPVFGLSQPPLVALHLLARSQLACLALLV